MLITQSKQSIATEFSTLLSKHGNWEGCYLLLSFNKYICPISQITHKKRAYTRGSFFYKTFVDHMTDAFVQAEQNFPPTFSNKFLYHQLYLVAILYHWRISENYIALWLLVEADDTRINRLENIQWIFVQIAQMFLTFVQQMFYKQTPWCVHLLIFVRHTTSNFEYFNSSSFK